MQQQPAADRDSAGFDNLPPLVEGQNIRTLAQNPWLLLPGVFIVIVVLTFNFVGDGLRDASW